MYIFTFDSKTTTVKTARCHRMQNNQEELMLPVMESLLSIEALGGVLPSAGTAFSNKTYRINIKNTETVLYSS